MHALRHKERLPAAANAVGRVEAHDFGATLQRHGAAHILTRARAAWRDEHHDFTVVLQFFFRRCESVRRFLKDERAADTIVIEAADFDDRVVVEQVTHHLVADVCEAATVLAHVHDDAGHLCADESTHCPIPQFDRQRQVIGEAEDLYVAITTGQDLELNRVFCAA